MGTKIGCAAVLLGVMCIVASVAANENAAGVAEKRGLSPIIAPVAAQGKYDAAYSVCNNMVPVDHKDFSLANAVSASTAPISYFMKKFGQQEFDIESWKTTLLNGPKHGELVQDSQYPNSSYMYHPNEGYLGIDQMTFLVETQGMIFKVIYSVHVGKMAPEYGPCPDYGVKELPNPTKGGMGSSLNILKDQ